MIIICLPSLPSKDTLCLAETSPHKTLCGNPTAFGCDAISLLIKCKVKLVVNIEFFVYMM